MCANNRTPFYLTSAMAAIVASAAVAQVSENVDVPNTFENGNRADAQEVNANFSTLVDAANANAAAINANVAAISALFGGDGSGGELTIDFSNDDWTDVNELPQNVLFRDVTVPAGVTLTVPAGTVLRCSGSFVNEGTIRVAGGATNRATGFDSGALGGPFQGMRSTSHPGDTLAAATLGDHHAAPDTTGASALTGGIGGVGVPQAVARTAPDKLRTGGGSGAGHASRNRGGGLIKVLCRGAITNIGEIIADGETGAAGSNGGGGGGIVILASMNSVDNTGGTITAEGGRGANSTGYGGPGGGGGGGIVVMVAPVVDPGVPSVSGGASGLVVDTVGSNSRTGGGGGGASGGSGGNGGAVGPNTPTTGGQAFDGTDGQTGYVIVLRQSPVYLFR